MTGVLRLLLLGILATAALAELPLGAPGLPETRTEEQLAPGLRYMRIQRGRVDNTQVFTVQVGVYSSADEPLQRLRAMGLEGWQRPAGPGQVSVRVGKMALGPFADDLERSLRASGFPEAKVLHTSDDPEADQGPWTVHVLELDWSQFGGKAEATVGRGPDGFVRKPLTELAQGALAAVNGDYFVEREEDGTPGDPTGVLVVNGQLLSEAVSGRSALVLSRGMASICQLVTEAVVYCAWRRGPVTGLNRRPGLQRDVSGHDTTRQVVDELVLFSEGFALQLPDGSQDACPSAVAGAAATIVGTGSFAEWLRPVSVSGPMVSYLVSANSQAIPEGSNAVGGGPQLLRDGELAIRARVEGFAHTPAFYYTFGLRRNPRTLAGVTEDGRLLLVVVDGRQPEWSVGASFEESARLLQALGARDGLNLDGGGSATMVIRGEVVNRPSEGKPRAIGDAILLKP